MKSYIKKHKLLFGASIILIILISFTEVSQALLFKMIVDYATGTIVIKSSYVIIASALFVAAVFTLEYLSKRVSAKFNRAVTNDFKQDILKSYLNSSIRGRMTSSEIISILTNDMKLIEENYMKSITGMFKDIFLFVITIIMLLRINIYMTIVVLSLGWIPIVIPQFFVKYNQDLKDEYLSKSKLFIERVKEIALGFEVIKSFHIEDHVMRDASHETSEAEKSKFKMETFEGFMGAVSMSSGMLIFFINLIIASYFVKNGQITIGSMIASIQLMNYVVAPMVKLSKFTTRIKSVKKVIEKNCKLIEENNIDDYGSLQKSFSFEDKLSINDLRFSYDENSEILKGISFDFVKGKKYAIVGESGCGKTTLLKILANQISGYKGDVLYDKSPANEYSQSSFLDKVSMIHQRVFMFKDSLRNNVCLYNTCEDGNLMDILKKSGLDKAIGENGKTVDTIIGEGGVDLSGGEMQRVAIARALYKNSDLLLVDEATAALDQKLSREIERTILNLDATVIAITHHMSPEIMESYDEILYLKDGKLVEHGPYKKLIAESNHLWNMINGSSVQTLTA